MSRPTCCTTVTALSTCRRSLTRSFNSATVRREREWGLLRRKSDPAESSFEYTLLEQRRPSKHGQRWDEPGRAAQHLTRGHASDQLGRARPAAPKTPLPSQEDTEQELDVGVTITVRGLSPRLYSKDFHRIFPPGLSSWSDQITKVQQLRNPRTLEPTGTYTLTFPSVSAAITYRGLLSRLHALSKLKVSSKNGLWESAVPDYLRQGCDNGQLNELEKQNAVAPGVIGQIQFERRGEGGGRDAGWRKKLDAVSEAYEWSIQGRNIVVLMEVYPPGLGEAEVEQIISEDGKANPLKWDVSKPVQWRSKPTLRQADREPAEHSRERLSTSDKNQTERGLGRFLLAFTDMSEAQTFNRHWNHRLVERQGDRELHRTLIHTSIIMT